MKWIKNYNNFLLEYYGDDFYTQPQVPFDNNPFFGSSEITASGDSDKPKPKEVGKEPQIPTKPGHKKKKKKNKKLHYTIDQDRHKNYIRSKKPGKAFL